MTLPFRITGSLCSAFTPVRLVSLSVKRFYAIALNARLPTVLKTPLEASVTLSEATTPVKLPTKQCPCIHKLVPDCIKGGISTMTPRILTNPLLSLPPILHIIQPETMLSYSKGSRGLFVP